MRGKSKKHPESRILVCFRFGFPMLWDCVSKKAGLMNLKISEREGEVSSFVASTVWVRLCESSWLKEDVFVVWFYFEEYESSMVLLWGVRKGRQTCSNAPCRHPVVGPRLNFSRMASLFPTYIRNLVVRARILEVDAHEDISKGRTFFNMLRMRLTSNFWGRSTFLFNFLRPPPGINLTQFDLPQN